MKYSVILKVDRSDPAFPIYSTFAEGLEFQGHTFLEMSCDRFECDPLYAQLRLDAPEPYRGLMVWIPHRLVVIAYGDEERLKVGFST
jgi:hypothetical protein